MEKTEMDMQEKIQGLTFLQQLLENLNQNIEVMAEKRALLTGLKVALAQFEANENDEILVQFSQGIYIQAKMKSHDKYLIGIGNSILVEKNKEETQQFISKKINEIEASILELQSQFKTLEDQLMSLYSEIQK